MVDHGKGPLEANILLRWLGVRYVPHLPCGFRCQGTIELGRKLGTLMPKREREWMHELLSMPMLWSSLHGIGEVVTPIVTINFRSEVNHGFREIRRKGSFYPDEAPGGLRFPYKPLARKRKDEIDAEQLAGEVDGSLWRDNGFVSRKVMDASHEMILSALKTVAVGKGGVVDLGAGNGELLRKLKLGGICWGIESDAGRVDRR